MAATIMRSGRANTPRTEEKRNHNGDASERAAFALGGLAGNNAHCAGFLEAALGRKKPVMISCTSGQIFWVAEYLRCLEERSRGEPAGMRALMEAKIREAEPFPFEDWNLAWLSCWGKTGVFRPPYWGYFADLCHNMAASGCRLVRDFQAWRRPFLLREMCQWPPEHFLEPDFPAQFYTETSQRLRDSQIGIAFNSYNPAEGCEYVYLNSRARELLKDADSEDPQRYDPGQRSSLSEPLKPRRVYEDISAEAVRRGLWLYWYGFDEQAEAHVDGAYFRQIMLSELICAGTIYVVRPLHFHWSGEMPASWAGLEDLKTKMAFNGAYIGEKNQILLVNKLVKDARRRKEQGAMLRKYRDIALKEVEMERPRGFFGYVFEDMRVFEEAYQVSVRIFDSQIAARET